MKQAFFRNLEKFKKENYKKLNIEYSKTNNIKEAIKPNFKKICYSTIRIYLTSYILFNSIENLNNDIVVYKNMNKEQKKEIKFLKARIFKLFNQTIKIMDNILDLI